ncbi:caspase family protein [Brunnivagina elsteri]|uniref:Peptidase C14 n=1 Tax=Brunnivagina elsteri CCALA 953 TaxID=987040 RepID=A0A2A2TIB1_9CYAN|nr:caspase family protein [Calothrix elsteri]PAX53470.1 peptidase C14 [Calothrix elsteri CCALA 953]
MAPIGIRSSHSTKILTSGEAKLWILLVGVNEYQDIRLPSLRYPSVDCQGLGEALTKATQGFPNKEVIIYHDFATQLPTIESIRQSLEKIVSQTQPQDSILLYFSGHGMLEEKSQQAVLCFRDTRTNDLLKTGLALQELLQMLGNSRSHQQMLCLDTCHSGDMNLLKVNGNARDVAIPETANPAPQMMDVLRQRASKSKGFCALLSCDRGQKSWEFPELGHGVFTYFLMQGLLGEAADQHGVIEADGLYKYVYRQTLGYIDKVNEQLRLVNQQKRDRGDYKLYPEYPLQTPKRIVEGVGELVLGFKSEENAVSKKLRRGLIIDGFTNNKKTLELVDIFGKSGGFQLEYSHTINGNLAEIRVKIKELISWSEITINQSQTQLFVRKHIPTLLLYLRGYIEEIEDGESWLVLSNRVRLSRSWLRQELRRINKAKQIIILDCPNVDSLNVTSLQEWVEDLQCNTECGQCIIAAAANVEKPEAFSQIILETLNAVNSQVGLPSARWIADLQKQLSPQGIKLYTWLSDTQAIIDILPGNISIINSISPVSSQLNGKKAEAQQEISPQIIKTKSESLSFEKLIIDSQQYTQLEQLLKQLIGPIASTILQPALEEALNLEQLIENLAAYLQFDQQKYFKQYLKNIILKPLAASPTKLGDTSTIDANLINKCTTELAQIIGPIASFIVQEELKLSPKVSRSQFIKKLAEQITEPAKAVEFEKRMLEQ